MSDGALYLVDIGAYTPGTGILTTTLYYASTPGYQTEAADTPSSTVYEERLIDPGTFSRSLFKPNALSGASVVGLGTVVLNNADGALDALSEYAFDGRPITIRRGSVGAALNAFTTVFTGTMGQVTFDFTTVTISITDAQGEVASLQMTTQQYGGTNFTTGSNEVDGTEDDLKDRYKPMLYGAVEGIAPPLVNTAQLTYQVSVTGIEVITGVYDNGEAITQGTGHASLAALLGATPTASTWDYYYGDASTGCYFRLGSSPAGVVTVDAAEGTSSPNTRTAAQVAERILMGPGGLASGSLDAASVTALDALNDAAVGVWVGPDGETIGITLDAVLQSIGAYWAVDRLGMFRLGRLDVPDSTGEVEILTGAEVLDTLERVQLAPDQGGLPSWRVTVRYRKNYTVQLPSNVAGAVTQARRNFLKEEWRSTGDTDPDVLARHPLSRESVFDCLLTTEARAQAEAVRLQNIFGQPIEFLRVPLPIEFSETIDLADTVTIDLPRFGWTGGVNFRVVGVEEDYEASEMTLEVFRVY